MLATPPRIDLLPEHLIDQIKAGEVIERPGNLIKEILENSVDAGATKLELTLKNNGLDLISLKDNGHGMRFEDLPLAFSRHATSKISRFEDLYRLSSFGFRGEALASISSISRLQCLTATIDAASEIRIEGGQTTYHGKRQKSGPGTELIIKDLFYNTPARLKFIQSQNSEKTFIKKVIYSFILSNPQIEFVIKYDEDEKEIFPTCTDVLSRIRDILPKAKDQVLSIERFYESNELELYLIPGHFKAPIKWQYVFINNRLVLDKQFHRVISNSLQQALNSDDYHYIAFFNLPADNIDVNVHPSKTVIKIFENSKLIGLLTSTIRELAAPAKSTPSSSKEEALPLNLGTQAPATLLSERHQYNMEGHFSPHNLVQTGRDTGIEWIANNYFLHEKLAYSARGLLQKYIRARLEFASGTIPLLVSEPYPSKGISTKRVEALNAAGLELEKMGADTYVLRAIPEWMNGFPLRPIVERLLHDQDFSGMEINGADWSSSLWMEMMKTFPATVLIQEKIAVDLEHLLQAQLQ